MDWNIKTEEAKEIKKQKQNIKIYSESTRELWRHPDLGGPWSYRDETVHCGETDTCLFISSVMPRETESLDQVFCSRVFSITGQRVLGHNSDFRPRMSEENLNLLTPRSGAWWELEKITVSKHPPSERGLKYKVICLLL